ncbi:MAG: hypothetical protein WA954_11920 [Parerythrobacter sp.]
MIRCCTIVLSALALTACAEEETLDTSYEETLPAPVADADGEVADKNMSADGRDEAVDAIAAETGASDGTGETPVEPITE